MIRLVDLSHTFTGRAGAVRALDPINLEVGAGEFVAIVGRSGCGKSTLLRLVAGLVTLVGTQVADGFPELQRQAEAGLGEVRRWLSGPPLHLTTDQLASYLDQLRQSVTGSRDQLVNGALAATTTAGCRATSLPASRSIGPTTGPRRGSSRRARRDTRESTSRGVTSRSGRSRRHAWTMWSTSSRSGRARAGGTGQSVLPDTPHQVS